MRIKPNKPVWIVHRFENIVENFREQAMPTKEDSKKYIGLEHLDSGSLHVRRWGTIIQLKGTKFRMKKGDLLFARRNAYLRRVAIAPHDGLFSAHGMIFRSKVDVILPDFLPFFLLSDVFMDRAITVSVGSLSPTINWGNLRYEEFSLPPLDEQKRLADLLWSVDETIEEWIKVLNQTEILIQSLIKEKLKSYHVSEVKVKDILEKNSKFKVGKVPQTEYLNEGEYPIINQSKTWIAGYSNNEELTYVGELPVLVFGDHTTEIKYVDFPFILGADGTKVVYPKPNIRARYLFYTIIDLKLKPVGYRRHFAILKDRKIKVPDLDKQDKCIEELDYLFNKKALQEYNILNLKNIQKQIINQVFGGKP